MTTALTIKQEGAIDFRAATDAAGVCREIVSKTAQDIGGRKYVRVEGWQAIAVAHGCIASAGDVQRIEGGVRATGYVKRGSDGAVISSAEGFVGDDEPVWAGGTDAKGREYPPRPEYAKRAMAQTRGISRACRSAFAHVVVMMDAGLETTPAEEVPAEGFSDRREPITMPTAAKSEPAKPRRNREPSGETEIVTGVLEAVSEKPTSKGSTRYGCKINETWYGTFDDPIGENAKALKGEEVKATVSKRGQYWDLHAIEPAEVATEQNPDADDPLDGDNIKF